MAAKPPKPPATLLKQKSPINTEKVANGNNDPSHTSTASPATTPTTPTTASSNLQVDETFSKLGIRRYNSRDNLLNNISNDNNNSDSNSNSTDVSNTTGIGGGAAARPVCNCTNISIMHLFHEMKQEFPTIPDPIVAQCVNENCHQRENCIQMLRNELALNPIPVQTYPAKVLQQHHINQQQQQKLNSPQQQKRSQSLTPSHPQPPQRHKNASATKPVTPLRPIRAAPTQPPLPTLQRLHDNAKNSAAKQPMNCDSVELVQTSNSNCNTSNNNSNLLKDVSSVQSPVCNNHSNNNSVGDSAGQTCDMPATVTATTNAPTECTRSSDFIAALNKVAAMPPQSSALLTATRPRPRPNTLDLQTSQQQLQRQQLNKQLQQHLQQRSQQQQQQQLATDVPEYTPQQQQKPIRKAPLPPIAPKPVFHNNSTSNNHNQYNYNNNNSCGNSPQSQSGGSCSAESNLTSPISSCGESEISANIGLPSQHFALGHINNNRNNNSNHNAATAGALTYQQQQLLPSSPLKSPIRHRSVITVQPEPPYARDFLSSSKIGTGALATSSNIGGSGGSTPTSQKSFTSVNLTLRQPTTAAVPQSTIDISAGPALSGYGSGLTYSSTSYDARRGYQQNFHITVTDEGGVFNASRIRPRNSGYYAGIEESDSPGGPAGGAKQTASTTQQQQSPTSAQAAYMLAQNITQPPIQSRTATTTSPTHKEMCVPLENSAFTETIKRQKMRRDKLATALRENKKKLGHVEEEINMLTETLSPGESERLDYEIERLRNDCQLLLNEIENIRRYGQLSEAERLQLQQQQHQQPFPRQRPPRPPIQQPQPHPYQYQQPELDSLQQQQQQHHLTAGSNGGNSGGSGHNSNAGTPNSTHLLPSPNAYQQRQNYASSHQPPSTDEEEYSDSNTDGGDDDDEPLERWPCSMCTFLNHPQLNICEACECVRILPGTVRIVPTASNPATAATTSAPPPATLMTANSATAAAAAAALAAAAPTALGPGGSGGSGVDCVGGAGAGAGAVTANARSPAGPTSARPTAAAARPVAAE